MRIRITRPPPSRAHLRPDRAGPVLVLALAFGVGADQDGDLPQVLVLAHQLVRLGDALEAERAPQDGPDLVGLDQLVGLVALIGVGEVRPDDLLLAHPQVAHVEVQLVAGRAGADHDLAERLDREHRGGEGRLADVLEDDVGRVAEDLLDALGERARDLEALLLLVGRLAALAHHPGELVAVDVVHRPQLLHQLALVGAGHDADRVGARHRAALGREHAEPAGAAPDQHALAGLELALADQHPVGGEVDEPVGGRLVPGQVLGAGEELLRLHLRELRERAPGGLVAPDHLARRGERIEAVDLLVLVRGHVAVEDDLVAGLPAGYAGAHLPDDPGSVRAADVVPVLGVVAVAHDRDRLAERGPDVVVVHAGRHHAHDDLERARLGHLDLLELEGVLRLAQALLADHPGGHRLGQRAGLDVQLRHLRNVHGHGLAGYPPAAEVGSAYARWPRRTGPRGDPPVGAGGT